MPNFRRNLSPAFFLTFFFFFTNYRLERSLYNEPSHLDLCCLHKPIIIARGSERVKGDGYTFREATLINCFHPSSEKGSSLKVKNSLSRGANFFLLQ